MGLFASRICGSSDSYQGSSKGPASSLNFVKWLAPNGATPDWTDQRQKSFACLILGQSEPDLFLMFNADTRAVDFSLPALSGSKIWRLAVDTSRTTPDDFYEAGKEPSLQGQISFRVEPRSSAILLTDG